MTNQEAIEFLKIERDHMTPTVFTERVEAMDMAISALHAQDLQPCNQLATDCISRQAAVDALWEIRQEEISDGRRFHDYCSLSTAVDVIKDLPSAEPQYTELTPVEAASEFASGSTMSGWYWLDDMIRLKQMGYAICRKKG